MSSDLETTLQNMPLAELKALRPRIDDMIAERERAEKQAVKAELAALAREKGFDLGDLFGDAPAAAKKPRAKVPPKYRNPADASQTWTGRGRKPKWVEEALASGGTLEDFLIPENG